MMLLEVFHESNSSEYEGVYYWRSETNILGISVYSRSLSDSQKSSRLILGESGMGGRCIVT